ncbi:MAG TPA: hypothetical protein VL400_26225 [Polyangiaceae bacterium]|nr:hypothetical protein [Polyangiaceae bacterium]
MPTPRAPSSDAGPDEDLLRGIRRGELARGIDLAREAGARDVESTLLLELGATLEACGDHALALLQYERALGIARDIGDVEREAVARRRVAALRNEGAPARDAHRDALEIATEGAAFRAPGATEFVPIQGRASLRRILVALAHHRLAAPGRCVPLETLGLAGWPGETASPASVAQRVRVATASLRKLGLQRVILTLPGGYLIDPRIGVAFS